MVTWTLVTAGYVVPAVLGAGGFKHAGDLMTRWGRSAADVC